MKILITPPGLARGNPESIDLLKSKGWQLDINETGQALERSELMERIAGADGVLLGTERVDREVMERAPRLKAISRFGVGLDNVDADCAKQRGIQVFNAAGANATAVADMAVMLMLALSRGVLQLDAQVRTGDWREPMGVELNRKTLGIIGFGNIGFQVAQRAKGFGMERIAYDLYPNKALAEAAGITFVDSLDELLSQSDYISLHVPHIPATHHLINRDAFKKMKANAILINTARGGIVDEGALAEALQSGRIRGAGLDVFEQEPLPLDSPLLQCPNIVFSPHTAADTVESSHKVGLVAAQHLIQALS